MIIKKEWDLLGVLRSQVGKKNQDNLKNLIFDLKYTGIKYILVKKKGN